MRVYQFRHVGMSKDSDYSVKLREVNSRPRINAGEPVMYLANFMQLLYTNH
jgi:hypothetical protein